MFPENLLSFNLFVTLFIAITYLIVAWWVPFPSMHSPSPKSQHLGTPQHTCLYINEVTTS